MKIIPPLSLLAFMLLASSSVVAETIMEYDYEEEEPTTLVMSGEELQQITSLCNEIADKADLKNEVRNHYVEQCIAIETMVSHGSQATDTSESIVHIPTN